MGFNMGNFAVGLARAQQLQNAQMETALARRIKEQELEDAQFNRQYKMDLLDQNREREQYLRERDSIEDKRKERDWRRREAERQIEAESRNKPSAAHEYFFGSGKPTAGGRSIVSEEGYPMSSIDSYKGPSTPRVPSAPGASSAPKTSSAGAGTSGQQEYDTKGMPRFVVIGNRTVDRGNFKDLMMAKDVGINLDYFVPSRPEAPEDPRVAEEVRNRMVNKQWRDEYLKQVAAFQRAGADVSDPLVVKEMEAATDAIIGGYAGEDYTTRAAKAEQNRDLNEIVAGLVESGAGQGEIMAVAQSIAEQSNNNPEVVFQNLVARYTAIVRGEISVAEAKSVEADSKVNGLGPLDYAAGSFVPGVKAVADFMTDELPLGVGLKEAYRLATSPVDEGLGPALESVSKLPGKAWDMAWDNPLVGAAGLAAAGLTAGMARRYLKPTVDPIIAATAGSASLPALIKGVNYGSIPGIRDTLARTMSGGVNQLGRGMNTIMGRFSPKLLEAPARAVGDRIPGLTQTIPRTLNAIPQRLLEYLPKAQQTINTLSGRGYADTIRLAGPLERAAEVSKEFALKAPAAASTLDALITKAANKEVAMSLAKSIMGGFGRLPASKMYYITNLMKSLTAVVGADSALEMIEQYTNGTDVDREAMEMEFPSPGDRSQLTALGGML